MGEIFPAVNRCVYCGREDLPLSDEHIIPEALNGDLELPRASCTPCQKVINGYEWTVGRRIFGDFRIKHNLRSKRPKKLRPRTIDVTLTLPDNSRVSKRIGRDEYPAPVFMYKFGKASLLRGLPKGTGIFDFVPYVIQPTEDMRSFHEKHGRLTVTIRMMSAELARMLAKIGHSYAVAVLGLGGFDALPENLDTILNRTNDVAYTVGSDLELREPLPGRGHELSIDMAKEAVQYSPVLTVERILVIAVVRLFAFLHTPEFHVVVGTLNMQNPRHVVTLTEHLTDNAPIGAL